MFVSLWLWPCSVLDWLVPPKPRWLGGNSWLLDGPEEVLQAEACSTTEDGDAPLLCPTGYECHIINPGNPSTGVPNRGQCVKHRRNSGNVSDLHDSAGSFQKNLDSVTQTALPLNPHSTYTPLYSCKMVRMQDVQKIQWFLAFKTFVILWSKFVSGVSHESNTSSKHFDYR
ncbi:hypothetical protein P4O66_003263 [Electrophorus voltai]|uniref:WAP domain-containing protein n=1 Tax=Electrophorus voltai TaxID=2609070 RepID=A0AAD9DLB2_9TELE|nr:hypothetical protein P4O66_003263 [Electrophorus voltai]